MPITFKCACDKVLRVPDEHAGKRVKCPACAGVATVPKPEPAPMFEVVEDPAEPPAPPPPPPKAKPVAKPVVADDEDEDDRRGYGVSKSARDEDDEPPRPKPKPKFKKGRKRREEGGEGGSGGSSAAAEIGGGLLSILIGAVLIVLRYNNTGTPSILGIILVVCGLIGVFKGLTGQTD